MLVEPEFPSSPEGILPARVVVRATYGGMLATDEALRTRSHGPCTDGGGDCWAHRLRERVQGLDGLAGWVGDPVMDWAADRLLPGTHCSVHPPGAGPRSWGAPDASWGSLSFPFGWTALRRGLPCVPTPPRRFGPAARSGRQLCHTALLLPSHPWPTPHTPLPGDPPVTRPKVDF